MKTMILAAAAVLSLGIGAAYAGDGDGNSAPTLFTLIPGVETPIGGPVGQPSAQQRAVAEGLYGPAGQRLLATRNAHIGFFAPAHSATD
jgi:hypothetical protein